jgi:2-dehydro-3-deoxyphosphogluconate aldolase/(4S)-4-hydroxy-2-oxoglutarate aldolase
MKLAQVIPQLKLMPLIFAESTAQAIEDATSLRDSGFPVVEILCRTPAALDAIRIVSRELPDVFVGAGTVLTVEMAEKAVEAGARFLVSPALDPAIMDFAKLRGLQFVPGVYTPSDIAIAMRNGYNLQKLFPTGIAGGIDYINALASPFGHTDLRLIAGAGINKDNYKSYLQHPLVAALIPDWLSPLRGDALRKELAITAKLLKASV